MATELPAPLCTPVHIDPLATIRRQMESHEEHVLQLARRVVLPLRLLGPGETSAPGSVLNEPGEAVPGGGRWPVTTVKR